MDHIHESPAIMMVPLYFLAIGAVLAGFLFKDMFIGELRFRFWADALFVLDGNDTIAAAHHVPQWVKLLPIAMGVTGILLALLFYIKARHLPAVVAGAFSTVHNFFYRKWYFDELYHAIGVVPAFFLGKKLWKVGDGKIIDGLGPDGIAARISSSAKKAGKIQTGYVYHYAFAMLIGVVVIVTSCIIWRYI
jgi:NADH-quinone oxidoreductase subunit L